MNMKRFAAFLTVMAAFGPLTYAQGSFWNGRDAYLGQTRPSDMPKIFAPGLLADPGTFPMGRVAFSKDGKEFYYTLSTSWSKGRTWLKTTKFDGHRWGKPKVIAEQFLSPTLSMDGGVLYMRKPGMKNVWQARRAADGWTSPTPFLQETYAVYDFMPTRSGDNYVGSDPSPEDVKNGITNAVAVLTIAPNGAVTVKSLGRPLNEPGFNGDLYIAPDESYMIVSAKESPTYQSELYISFRKTDHSWTAPVSLGPKINDGLAHRWGQYVTPDGKYLFYSHGTSEKDCAIYWVRFDKLLKSLRPAQL
jgi:hypothetical protein